MKRSKYTFFEGFLGMPDEIRGEPKVFDWDNAARAIREIYAKHPDLIAEAGLQDDWESTGGVIFKDGSPVTDDYTYLASTWATPTLILSWDGEEQLEIPCWVHLKTSHFGAKSKWDGGSLKILNGV